MSCVFDLLNDVQMNRRPTFMSFQFLPVNLQDWLAVMLSGDESLAMFCDAECHSIRIS